MRAPVVLSSSAVHTPNACPQFETGYPDQPRNFRIIDLPASYHGGSGGLSFADGHSELRRWKDARTTPAVRPGVVIPYDRPSPNNPDIAWMQERATRRGE